MAAKLAAASAGSRPSAAAGGGATAPALNRRSTRPTLQPSLRPLDLQDSRSLHDLSFYHVIGLGEETWPYSRLPSAIPDGRCARAYARPRQSLLPRPR